MAINHPKAGVNSIPAYQLSGVPYVTGSTATEIPANSGTPLKISFPYVTRFFEIHCSGAADVRVGFSEAGVKEDITSNYFIIANGERSPVLELRTKELYFLGDTGSATGVRITAGLTTIESSEFPVLTGSIDGTTAFEGVG